MGAGYCVERSLPGLTRQSIIIEKKMDAPLLRAITRVFDAMSARAERTHRLAMPDQAGQ
jgi:hypothetical protein